MSGYNKEINKKIGSSLFNLLVTIDEHGNYKACTIDKKIVDIPNYCEDVEAVYPVVEFFKKRGYAVSIGYVEKEKKLLWNTKITKNKSIYDSGLRNSMPESICYAAIAFIDKKNKKKQETITPNNIVTIDFKKT